MKEEMVDVIDEYGNELGFAKEKSKVHKDGDWHRGAHLWIIKDNNILLQKRSPQKKFFPGKFDVACAGHVKAGETYVEALQRELEEELGIKERPENFRFIEKRNQVSVDKIYRMISREVNCIYLMVLAREVTELRMETDEISELRLFPLDQLRKLLKENPEMFIDDRAYFLHMIDKIEDILKY